MRALAELQSAFQHAILAGDAGALEGLIEADGIAPAERLQVYRNNAFISLREALGANFPVTRRLVGEDYFAQVARAFVRALLAYGAGFAEFLAGCPGAAAHPYLGDVARLEWAWVQAYHAADAEPVALDVLARAPVTDWGEARVKLHPSARFLVSPYPVAAIWQANQEGAEPRTIGLGLGADHLLVIRPREDVEIARLAPDALEFLARLAAGETLAAAAPPGFDPTETLTGALVGGYFVALQFSAHTEESLS